MFWSCDLNQGRGRTKTQPLLMFAQIVECRIFLHNVGYINHHVCIYSKGSVISNYHPNCLWQIRKQLSSNKTRPQHEICYNPTRWPTHQQRLIIAQELQVFCICKYIILIYINTLFFFTLIHILRRKKLLHFVQLHIFSRLFNSVTTHKSLLPTKAYLVLCHTLQ